MMQVRPLQQWLEADRPSDTCIAYDNQYQYPLSDLRHLVKQLVQELQKHPEQQWAICTDNSLYFVASLLAVLYAQRIPILLGHHRLHLLKEQRNLYEGIITDTVYSDIENQIVIPDAQKNDGIIDEFGEIASDAYAVLFTSGSTGIPKRIVKTVAVLNQEIAWISALWGNKIHAEALLSTVSHQHLYGLTFRIMLPMSMGIPFYTEVVRFPEQLAQLGSQIDSYMLVASPAFLKRIDSQLHYGKCQFLLSAAGELLWETAQLVHSAMHQFPYEIYGSTETGVMAWRHHVDVNTAWCLFDDVHIMQDAHHQGWITSPIMVQAQCELSDVLAFIGDTKHFYLKGRKDRIVKIEEKKIALDEVEQRIQKCDGVAQAVVVPVYKKQRLYLGAVVVLTVEGEQIRQQKNERLCIHTWQYNLQQTMETVAIPRFWRIVEEIPCNTEGKIVIKTLQEMFE